MIFDYQPSFSRNQARAIAAVHFGIDGTATVLPSDRDQNFVLETEGGKRFVLKISNATASNERIRFENHVIRVAAEALGPVLIPSPIRGIAGLDVVEIEDGGRLHQTRILKWVEGKRLALFRPHTPDLFFELGARLGRLSTAMQSLTETGETTSPEWDLRQAEQTVRSHREFVTDRRYSEIIDHFLARYEDQTVLLLGNLPQQVVHNDANDHNILASVDANGTAYISGIIDFSDAAVCYRIADLAIAAAYGMMDKLDPLGAARSIASGFCSECLVLEAEADVLFDLICIRLCTSVVLSTVRSASEPDNEYVTIS
ncbi:MAG: phosphotransferase, partial [Rhodothermia bacterium]